MFLLFITVIHINTLKIPTMPKFVKLLLRDKNEGDMIQWRLVIDSESKLWN